MSKIFIVTTALLLLGACGTPTYIEGQEYAFVGCHTVVQNPAVTGERAFMGFFDLRVGDKLWFKQISPDNEVKAVMTAIPCE
tara:strand:- start:202 stop:447 length:246 start_codon:yes stop_codon:yes gene_type:complete